NFFPPSSKPSSNPPNRPHHPPPRLLLPPRPPTPSSPSPPQHPPSPTAASPSPSTSPSPPATTSIPRSSPPKFAPISRLSRTHGFCPHPAPISARFSSALTAPSLMKKSRPADICYAPSSKLSPARRASASRPGLSPPNFLSTSNRSGPAPHRTST